MADAASVYLLSSYNSMLLHRHAVLVHSELQLQAFRVTLDYNDDVRAELARAPPNWPKPGSDGSDVPFNSLATPC
jgi:hypothetical protein